MSSPNLTRRDWFRLKLESRAGTQSTAKNPTNVSSLPALTPLTAPPNHDGLDLQLLPPVSEAIIDLQQAEALIEDIATLAQHVSFMQRSFAAVKTEGTNSVTLAQLRWVVQALASGSTQRIQIRYHWNAAYWIDTLERKPEGFRLLRIQHGIPGAAQSRPPNTSSGVQT